MGGGELVGGTAISIKYLKTLWHGHQRVRGTTHNLSPLLPCSCLDLFWHRLLESNHRQTGGRQGETTTVVIPRK